MSLSKSQRYLLGAVSALALLGVGAAAWRSVWAAGATLPISQLPLTITTPARPQVVIAITNSQSMDGSTLAGMGGAIMTGSGGVSGMSGSSSPVNYTVPAGFTPPVSGGSGSQPYTVTQSSGGQLDNSPSRLNVAKAGIASILNSYLPSADFGLLSYQLSNLSLSNTWVYYMSPASGFGFTSTAGSGTVSNPCYRYGSASSSAYYLYWSCGQIDNGMSVSIGNYPYMQVASSSDDADKNDVLYSSAYDSRRGRGVLPVTMTYGTPNPSNPYSYYGLSDYNRGQVRVAYPNSVPDGLYATNPTNAGFVPYSPQVLYAQRGWGYSGGQSATQASVDVAMSSLGSGPSSAALSQAYSQFSPLLQPETSNAASGEWKAAAGQSPIYALLNTAQSSFNSSSSSTSSSGCASQKYVVLVTDGLPTQDKSGYNWPPIGSAAAKGYGVYANFNADGTLADSNSQALKDTISQIQTLASNGIKTYVIGLGAGVDPTLNPDAAKTLKAMAAAGGTGNYYPATNPQAFTTALNSVMGLIISGAYSQASVSINATALSTQSQAFLASFNPSDTTYSDWTGNLSAYALSTVSGKLSVAAAPAWQAQAQLDKQAAGGGWDQGRLIATWDGSKGVPLRWPVAGSAGISSAQQSMLQSTDSNGPARLNYLRGDVSNEARNGGGFRNRTHVLGDIVNSSPVYVGAASGPYSDSSYLAFIKSTQTRPPMLYVGANDGMLHALDAKTGKENFAFAPNGVFANLPALTSAVYSNAHRYFVDGSPQAGEAQFADGSWHTLLTGGLGGGGKSVYALDVTSPDKITDEASLAAAVLWEFSDAGMGYSYSKPAVARVSASAKHAVFFGNGYGSAGNGAILYALNAQTGALLAKIDLCAAVSGACNAALPQGLSSVALANTGTGLGLAAEVLYAGDLQGNLWAVNVAAADPSAWTARLLFTAQDASGKPQPITSTPVATLNPGYPKTRGLMLYFGTGQLLTQADLSNRNSQAFYGVFDNFTSSGLTPGKLLAQTLSQVAPGDATNGGQGQKVTAAKSTMYDWRKPPCPSGLNCPSYSGWMFTLDFAGSGSRLLSDPTLYAGNALFTTFAPSATPCTAGGTAFLMGVNYATGGPPNAPFFDINGNGKVDGGSVLAGNLPASGIALGQYFAGAPALLGASLGGVSAYALTGGQQVNPQAVNASPNAFWRGWWQVQ